MNRNDYYGNGDDPYEAGDEQVEQCEVCHQEFTGTCPINSADCPYADVDDDDEDEGPDFEDVENLDALLDADDEVEQLIEDDDETLPPDALIDDEDQPDAEDKVEKTMSPEQKPARGRTKPGASPAPRRRQP